MIEAGEVDIAASRPAEGRSTHSGTDHLDRYIGRALEGRASTELDDVSTALGDTLLDIFPSLSRESFATDECGERLTGYRSTAGEDSHSFAVTAVGASAYDFTLSDTEVFS
jgi:hypothetical protein